MFPALASSGEVVLAECLPGMHGRVREGDVVICVRPVEASEHIVKRVAAVAGQQVAILPPARGGAAWPGPWVPPPRSSADGAGPGEKKNRQTGGDGDRGGGGEVGGGQSAGGGGGGAAAAPFAGGGGGGAARRVVVVPPGHVWVQGDNMVVSRDSREYGPVPLGAVRGRVVCTVWPRPRRVDGGGAVVLGRAPGRGGGGG